MIIEFGLAKCGTRFMVFALALAALLAAATARANDIQITNVTLRGLDDTTAYAQFDLSWKNSWRWTNINHDAAWVFFKVQLDGQTDWQHVRLEGSGTNPPDYSTGSGTPIEIVVPDDKVGLFVRKAGEGAGDVAVTGVKAVWNFSSNGLSKTQNVRLQAFAVEMVYVAEGSFKVGSGGNGNGELYEGGGGTSPFEITNEGPLELADAVGKLWCATSNSYMEGAGTLSSDFPKGYAAFYCMKYEITQGQYVDFLNALTRDQQTNRCFATNLNYYMSSTSGGSATVQGRNTVQLTQDPGIPAPRLYSTVTPDRACNFLLATDGCAFTDWSGLRPMTELEFEKACRGPAEPVPNEFAWGTAAYTAQTGHNGTDGSGSETATPAGANCCCDIKMGGPVRVGIYATGTSSREAAGASYWGIMELSGNLLERCVSIGEKWVGRYYTGLHGNGILTSGGDADVSHWPKDSGFGFRGGAWNLSSSEQRVSDRIKAKAMLVSRWTYDGWRAVRSAPSGVGP